RGDDGLFRPLPNEEGEIPALAANDDVRLVSGALEGSNVSAIETMVAMIDTARRYDMQMKVISSADENAQRANGLLSIQG
ncbi:flagellar basal body rod C-terminal domain-containing protein, partial [Litchfieldella rifensis]